MRTVSIFRMLAAIAAAGVCSCSAAAEIYKWVDEKGVTNYGSAPPEKAKSKVLDPQAAAVSVYTPPPQASRQLESMMRDRIDRLEGELQAERRARQTQQASLQSEEELRRLAYEECVRDRRVDCDQIRDGLYSAPYYYGAYAPAYGYGPSRRPGFPTRPVARPLPSYASSPAFAPAPPVFAPAPPVFPPASYGAHQKEPSRRVR
jgi:hypothetical protein